MDRLTRIWISLSVLLLLFLPAWAELDDDFSNLEGLGMFRLADKELDNYNYESARYQYETILENLAPIDTLQRIYGLAKLAKTVRRTYDLEGAWARIEQAESLAKPFFRKDHPVQAYLYHEKGELASFYGRFVDAENSLVKAREIRTRLYGPKNCITAFTTKELGEFYFFFAQDYLQAEPLIRESFQVLVNCIEENTYGKALAYYDLSCIYWRNSENLKALELAEGALDILMNCPVINWDFVPNVYNLMAIIASADGHDDEAIRYNLKALEVRKRYRPDNIERIVSESYHLAQYYIREREFSLAEKYLGEALALFEAHDLTNDDLYPALMLEYARLYGEKGDLVRCIKYYERGIEGFVNLYGECHLRTVTFYHIQADYLEAMGEYEAAGVLFGKALKCLQANSEVNDQSALLSLVYSYYDVGRLMQDGRVSSTGPGNEAKALECYTAADSVLRVIKAVSNWRTTVLDFGATFQDMYRRAIEVSLSIQEEKSGASLADRAFAFMESNKSFLLYQSIVRNLELRRDDLPDSLKNELERTEARLQMLSADTTITNKVSNLRELELLKARQQVLLQEMQGSRYDAQVNLYSAAIPSLKECQAGMKGDDCLLQYFHTGDDYYLIGIRPDSVVFSKVGRLDSLVVWLELLRNPDIPSNGYATTANRYESLAFELYRDLIPTDFCAGHNLVIVPHHTLYYVPFEALVTEAAGAGKFSTLRYLMLEHDTRYAYSVTQYLKLLGEGTEASRSILGIFPAKDLEQSRREAQYLLRSFRKVDMTDERDTKVEIVEKMRRRAVVHIASHGYADPEQMNANYLDLYQGERLYDYEISNLFLNSQLVYLNACETNVGLDYSGEGVFSLSKAFMQAACPTVISSLWKIPDEASASIARHFYQEIKAGARPATALSSAKQAYLADVSERSSHPYYWSGILLIGNDDALHLKKDRSILWSASIGLVVLLSLLFGISRWRQGRYSLSRR